jgi:hypothetical protein
MMADDVRDTVAVNLISIFALPQTNLLPHYAEADVETWYNDLTPVELLAGLRSLGIAIKRHGADGIAVRDPQHALTHRLRQAITRRRHELLILAEGNCHANTPAAVLPHDTNPNTSRLPNVKDQPRQV